MKTNADVTCADLRRLLNYDPETGVFTHRARRCGVTVGSVAGSPDPQCRYVRIKIGEKLYLAHRLAWLYVTGKWPNEEIDHADRNRTNNRFSNLREATKSQNMCNRALYRNSSTGAKGVSWHRQHRKYVAAIQVRGTKRHIGLFESVEEAARAYREAAARAHGEFAAA